MANRKNARLRNFHTGFTFFRPGGRGPIAEPLQQIFTLDVHSLENVPLTCT